MEQINIDASLVGLIIGRGGENLRRVEADTGARVQFMTNGHDRDSGGERVCNIQGTRAQITAARRAIDSIIAENEKSSASGPPARKPAAPSGNAGGYGASIGMPPSGQGPAAPGPGAPNLREGGSFSKSRAYTGSLFCQVWPQKRLVTNASKPASRREHSDLCSRSHRWPHHRPWRRNHPRHPG